MKCCPSSRCSAGPLFSKERSSLGGFVKPLGAAVLALLANGLISCGESIDTAREEAAVRAVWDEAAAALTAKDWSRYAEVYAQEPFLQVIHPSQRDWIRGWDAFQERYRAIMASDAQWAAWGPSPYSLRKPTAHT